MKYTDIVFDIDGTLVDNEEAVLDTWQECLQKCLGRHFGKDEIRFVLGLPGRKSMEKLGIADPVAAFEEWGAINRKYRGQINAFKGIEPMLSQLRTMGFRLGIVTSRLPEELYGCHVMGPLLHYFDYKICVTDTARAKPEADPLLAYMSRANTRAEHTLYVGDSVHDRECARNAGVDFALAQWGGGADADGTERKVLHTPSALYSIL